MKRFTKSMFHLLVALLFAGCGYLGLQAQSAITIDTKATYTLTNMFLGDGVALDGVAAMMRPSMRKAVPGSKLQQWQFADLGNGYYRLSCVGVAGAALEGGAKDQGALMNGVANQSGQMWRALDAGNGYVTLVNMFTEKDNYAFEGGALDGGSLITLGGHSGQAWKLNKVVDIKVSNAIWFNGTRKADVTAKVQEIANTGVASFEARNHILGADPAAGVQKTLTVTYTKNGVTQTKSVLERQFFVF